MLANSKTGGGNLSKAFTLIEIVSAIVIIGIIAIITVPITVRVINESKRRSFYATAEGIVKATLESNLKNEEDYGEYFLERESITFKFSKNEGKEGESVELVNGKKIKLSFEGKSPVGGEVKLYKNGDVEVVNLTDGTYYANKDTDTELVVSDTTESLTRGELQVALEKLQEEVKQVLEENKKLKEENTKQDSTIKANQTAIERITTNIDTINTSMLAKTYPVGSIYISENSTNPSTLFGGTWINYGTGRTLVGINTSDANFNAVSKTGGVSSITLATSNLPAHTHSVPALTGSTNEAGAHTHRFAYNGSTFAGWHYATTPGQYLNMYEGNVAASGRPDSYKMTIASAGAHTHTVTTNASNTGSTGSASSFTNLQPYITVYMWKRVS